MGKPMKRRVLASVGLVGIVGSVLFAAGCGTSNSGSSAPPATAPAEDDAKTKQAIQTFVHLAHDRYATSLEKARSMRDAIESFLAAPSESGLVAARAAWVAAREPYGETEAFRFFGGPIDDDKGPEGRVNAWPLDEAYIDYTVGAEGAGIVNHATEFPAITKELLADANEKDGESNIATGYHAIEFLLWGQDLSETGPGSRAFTDYTTAPNADRRAEYLRVVTNLLVEDLEYVVAGWDDTKAGSYAQSFEAMPAKDALTKAFTGIVMLGGLELSRERMGNAFEKGEQEEEHSCFSDNTTADLLGNARGIENVYLRGGIGEVVAAKDATKDAEVRKKLAEALVAIGAIPAPFDRAIVDLQGRAKVQAAIDATNALTDALNAAAEAVGVTVDLEQ
jgi:putative iron-regulated protein